MKLLNRNNRYHSNEIASIVSSRVDVQGVFLTMVKCKVDWNWETSFIFLTGRKNSHRQSQSNMIDWIWLNEKWASVSFYEFDWSSVHIRYWLERDGQWPKAFSSLSTKRVIFMLYVIRIRTNATVWKLISRFWPTSNCSLVRNSPCITELDCFLFSVIHYPFTRKKFDRFWLKWT